MKTHQRLHRHRTRLSPCGACGPLRPGPAEDEAAEGPCKEGHGEEEPGLLREWERWERQIPKFGGKKAPARKKVLNGSRRCLLVAALGKDFLENVLHIAKHRPVVPLQDVPQNHRLERRNSHNIRRRCCKFCQAARELR